MKSILSFKIMTSQNEYNQHYNLIKKIESDDHRIFNDPHEENIGTILWGVDNWKSKRIYAKLGVNKSLCSQTFYSHKNGYKMMLQLYPYGFGFAKGSHISISNHILSGPFDERLEWPFRHSIKLELIDPDTKNPYLSKTLNYKDYPSNEIGTFPHGEWNVGFSLLTFISHEELLDNPSLIEDDKILIKVTVQLNP